MKTNFKLLMYLSSLIIAIFLCPELGAQIKNITYSYDQNGSRKSRILSVEEMDEGYIEFPFDEKSSKTKKDPEELVILEGENINIFPNPTSGMLRIVFENFPISAKGEYLVFSLGGNQLKNMNIILPETEVNLSDLNNGIYILIIRISGNIYNYKIIKK